MVIARALVDALREAGHDADIIVTPQNRFGRQASAYLATWLTDVTTSDGRAIDQVISLRFPSYAVRHPKHVCWLNHTMREYYDLWEPFSATLSPRGLVKERVRRAGMHMADRYLSVTGTAEGMAKSGISIADIAAAHVTRIKGLLASPGPAADELCERVLKAIDDPHLTESGLFRFVDHPREGRMRAVSSPRIGRPTSRSELA